MNTSLRRISVTIMALIVLLLANATLTQVFTADGLRADPRNQRILLDEYSRQRGQISAGGQLLAYSTSTNGHFRFLREYPNPLVYAPVTGFYSLQYSSTGLEHAEDTVLNGSDERLFGRRLADFFTGRDPRGGNVSTTINPSVQEAAWDAMQQGCSGPCKGAVVALEPSTGKILAMVSSPSFDPNLLASHDGATQSNAWQHLRDDPDSPLVNRATSETTARSTFKVITTAAALQAGATPSTQVTTAPRIPLPDSTATLENYGGTVAAAARRPRCTTRSPSRATPPSSNSESRPEPTPYATPPRRSASTPRCRRRPLQVAGSTVGPIADAAALGMTSIGQKDVALTPLQNAMIAATIANDGVTMAPYLVEDLKGPDLAHLDHPQPARAAGSIRAGRRYNHGPNDRCRAGHVAKGCHLGCPDRVEDRYR